MADLAYRHGVTLTESTDTPSVVRVQQNGVTFVNGTAPDADPASFPLARLSLVTSRTAAAELGAAGTLRDDVLTVFDEGGTHVIVNRVAEGLTPAETRANLLGNPATRTGLWAALRAKAELGLQPRVIVTAGETGTWIEDGITSIAVTAHGAGYTEAPTVVIEAEDGDDGSGAAAVATVEDGKVVAITITAAGDGYTLPPTVTLTGGGGAGALAVAHVGDVGNPFVSALATICPKIRARAYIDGPNTTDAAAVRFRNTVNSDRILIIDPKALKIVDGVPVQRRMAPVFAGVRSRVVSGSEGVSGSVSNKIIRSIDGVARTVAYPDDSNYLNERAVATVINERGGLRTWGSRLATDNALWVFDSVRATADMVNEAIEDLYFLYVDRKFTPGNLKMLVDDGTAALKTFVNSEDILGGRVWLSDLNTPDLNVQGNVFLCVEFEPVGLMEQIRITTSRNILYYTLLLDRVRGAIENGPLTLAA